MTEMYVKFISIPKGIKKTAKVKKRKKYTLREAEGILQFMTEEMGPAKFSIEIHSGKQIYDFSDLTIATPVQTLDELLLNDIYHSAAKLRKADMASEEADALEAVAEEIQVQYEKSVGGKGLSEPVGPIIGKTPNQKDTPFMTQPFSQSPLKNKLNEGIIDIGKKLVASPPVPSENPTPSEIQHEPIETKGLGTHVPQQNIAAISIEKQPLPTLLPVNKGEQRSDKSITGNVEDQPLSIVEYMDFSKLQEDAAVAATIRELETSSQSEQETLMELLGIDKRNMSSLDQKKLHFACELMRKDFLLSLKSSFLTNISELKSLTATKLEESFHVNRLDYESFEEDISELVSEEQQLLINKMEHAKEQLEQQLTAENTKEQELLTAKQQTELESLKLQHKEIQEKRMTEATHRKEERLARFIQEERQKNAQQLEHSEQTLKRTELKKRKEKALVEKQKILAACGKGIMGTIEKLDQKKELYFKDLLESVQEMEPKFKQEVEQEQQMVLKDRELAALEEKNRLTEEQLELDKKQRDEEQEAVSSQNQMTQQLQELLLMQRQQALMGTLAPSNDTKADEIAALKETIRQLGEKINTPEPIQQSPTSSFSKHSLFKGLGLGVCGLVLGGLISFMIFSGGRSDAARQGMITTNSAISTTVSESRLSASEETTETMTSSSEVNEKSVEKEATKAEVSTPEVPVLEELLREKKYQEAAKHFPDRLEEIEQRLYVDREVDELTAFNLAYKTRFGQLDEAALRTDVWKVVEQYNQLSGCLLDLLSYRQKEDISLSLLKVGRIYEAQQLLL